MEVKTEILVKTPIEMPIFLDEPRRLTPFSAWHEHIPFAMFLVEVLRPETIVELGTQWGDSYCAFCQAVETLKLNARCFAVDTWKGDAHAGFYGSEVLENLRAHHDTLYGSFSRLIQSTFDEALSYIANGSVDLLHIDGCHSYEAVKHDFESWLPKLSKRGVVLFHDTNVRERDFEVWRLWDELRRLHPHFEFVHGHGLAVLGVGKDQPKRLRELFECSDEQVAKTRELFFRLGQRLTFQVQSAAQKESLHPQVAEKESAVQDLSSRLARLQVEFDEKALWADRLNNELAANRDYLARLQLEFDQKALWADRLNSELAASRDQLARLQVEFDEKTRWAERLQAEVQTLTFLWSKATRLKRALVFFTLAPLDWAVGCAVLASEIASRLLRKVSRRKAPLVAPADTSRCSIIVLSWEGKDLLGESLPPLLKAVRFHGGNHEVIVLDNGSTDGTSEYVADHFPEVRVVRSERNIFYTGGNNLGVKVAKNDIVILLNNDMFVYEDFLGRLLEGFRGPEVFAVASQVFLADHNKRREETGKTRATFNGCDLDWAHDAILPSDEERKYVPVFWGHGGAVALDRQKFLWLGGLDTLYDPFYVEDADLSYKAWKVGWRCLLAIDSHVVHKHRGTNAPRYGSRFITQIIRRNQYLFIWKNFGDLGKLVKHFLRSPRRQIGRAGVPGVGIRLEAKALLGAAERLSGILVGKLRLARSVVRSDEEILRLISTPAAETIRASEVDFRGGDCGEQLGEGWYPREQASGTGFRWMSKKASIFLRVPAHASELCVTGYVPNSLPSDGSRLSLTLDCNGKQKHFRLREGPFEQRWTIELAPGASVRVELTVSRAHKSPTDSRTLGIIVHRIALCTGASDEHRRQSQELHPPVSISNPRASRGLEAGSQRRILMVCAYLPCQGIHGGGNMMFHLIRQLSKRHLLTVLAFYERDEERELIPQLAPFCDHLDVIYRGQNFDVSNLLGLKPPEIVNEFYHQRMYDLVSHHLHAQKFDLIQCEYLQTAHFAEVDRSIPAVLTNLELLSLSYANRYRSVPWRSPRKKASALAAWMRMLNYEEKLSRRFAAVVVLTEREQEFLARYAPGVNVCQHPMGVDSDFFRPGPQPPDSDSVVFVGNFRHSPNVSGAMWFLQRVWPRIRARNPQACCYIVGGSPTPELLAMDGLEGVAVTGFVEDVRPYLERAAVFVAPILDGGGLRTKVLEAWAMQRPVVGTRLAFAGLTNRGGEVCCIAEGAEHFADRVCELLETPDLAREIGERARQFVVSSFSWEAFADLYDRIYQQILEPAESSVVRAAMAAGG